MKVFSSALLLAAALLADEFTTARSSISPQLKKEFTHNSTSPRASNGYEFVTSGTCESHTNGRCRATVTVQECEAARDELQPGMFVVPDVESSAFPIGCSVLGASVIYFNTVDFTESTCSDFDCLCACEGTPGPPDPTPAPGIPELATSGTCESHTDGRCRTAATVQECEAARDELHPDMFVVPDVVSTAYPIGCLDMGFGVIYFNTVDFTDSSCSEFDCLCMCDGTTPSPPGPTPSPPVPTPAPPPVPTPSPPPTACIGDYQNCSIEPGATVCCAGSFCYGNEFFRQCTPEWR